MLCELGAKYQVTNHVMLCELGVKYQVTNHRTLPESLAALLLFCTVCTDHGQGMAGLWSNSGCLRSAVPAQGQVAATHCQHEQ